MLKIFSATTLLSLFLMFVMGLSLLPSCKKYDNNAQIRRVDTLINWNNNGKAMLIIDKSTIMQRTDSMRLKISAFDSNTIKLKGDQLKSDLVQFNGLLNRYNNFIDNYADIEFENSANSRFLDDLKKKIIDHQIQVNSIDTMLSSEEKLINAHLSQIQEIVQPIFSIEEMYIRLNNRINPIYENIVSSRNLKSPPNAKNQQ